MTMTTAISVSNCPMCGKEGHKEIVERLPKGGALIRFIHDDENDESKHEWARYESGNIERHIIRRNPKRMRCPDCGKIGIINKYRPDEKKIWHYEYLIIHEKIKGTWGKEKKPKQKRCYIKIPEQRDQVLKKLGLFVK